MSDWMFRHINLSTGISVIVFLQKRNNNTAPTKRSTKRHGKQQIALQLINCKHTRIAPSIVNFRLSVFILWKLVLVEWLVKLVRQHQKNYYLVLCVFVSLDFMRMYHENTIFIESEQHNSHSSVVFMCKWTNSTAPNLQSRWKLTKLTCF